MKKFVLISCLFLLFALIPSTITKASDIDEFYDTTWVATELTSTATKNVLEFDLIPVGGTSTSLTNTILVSFGDSSWITVWRIAGGYYSMVYFYDDEDNAIQGNVFSSSDVTILNNGGAFLTIDLPAGTDNLKLVIMNDTDYLGNTPMLNALNDDTSILSGSDFITDEIINSVVHFIYYNGFADYDLSDSTSYSYELGRDSVSQGIDFDDLLDWVFMPFEILELHIFGDITFGHIAFISIMFGLMTFLFKFKGGK